jgi:hypothetical protein
MVSFTQFPVFMFPLTLDGSGMEDPVELLHLQDDGGLIILWL